MARRKYKRSFRGFGLAKADHQRRAVDAGKAAKYYLRGVKSALAAGNCAKAIDNLASAGSMIGQKHAHAGSRHAIIKRRKPGGRGSVGGQGNVAYYGWVRRVIRACAKERY